ncbi:YhfC family intramembrane metalloprotease [Paraburkholderia sp.]|uniref:YhfC family intramembrane metalloprotease n=1 Tax=Paraburkholderia sp. TaxID=1926495 RepID=UPI002615CD62|nr:YhfC family intramembrane metalloprotease [Paraburkholderia sp.]
MVVAPLTLTCLVLSTLFAAALPIVLYRRLRIPLGLNARDAIAGIAVFALFASVIERALNGYVLHQNATTAAWLSNPVTFVIYGALAAGVCEEVGRFIAMKMMWQRAAAARAAAPNPLANSASDASFSTAPVTTSTGSRPSVAARVSMRRKTAVPPSSGDSTALGYGIGHGGAEAWIVGVLVQIQWIVFAVIANRGELDSYLGNLPDESLMRIHVVLASLSPLTAGIFLLERVAALVLQIGLSVLMWRGVRAGWYAILPLAIIAHALVDLPAALFQVRVLPLYAVDGLYALAAIIVVVVLVKMFQRTARIA